MKKFAALFLVLAAVMGIFAGCGNAETETTASTPSAETTATTPADTTATQEKETTAETTKPADTTPKEETTMTTNAPETTAPTEERPPVEYTYEKEEGLVAYWAFDTINDGIVADVTGNGHDGKVTGSPMIVKGHTYNGLRFTKYGQHVTVEDAEDLNFTEKDSFTLEAWFSWDMMSTGPNWPCLFQKGLVLNKNFFYYGFWINPSSKQGALGMTGGNGTKTYNIMSNGKLDSGWHKATAVQDGKAGTIAYFIDDEFQAQGAAINGSSKGYPLTIGFDGQFLGVLDEIKIYNYAKDMKVTLSGVDSMNYGTYAYTDTVTGKKVSLPYRSYFPTDYDSSEKKDYPILLFLHGYGECGTDNAQQIRVLGGSNKLLDRLIENDTCVIIAPQCPADPASMNWVPLNKKWNTASRELTPNPTPTLAAAAALLQETIEKERIDTSRVYISGVSMGGYGTWEMLARYPKLFAAAIPLCGAGIPSKAAELTDVAIWAMHGTADPTVPVSGTQDMEDAIKEAGGTKFRATYYNGVSHNVWPYAYAEPELIDWLLAQKK